MDFSSERLVGTVIAKRVYIYIYTILKEGHKLINPLIPSVHRPL